jgi:hypothetical protein
MALMTARPPITPTTMPPITPADRPPSLPALLGRSVGEVEGVDEAVALDLVAAGMRLADGVAVVEVIF